MKEDGIKSNIMDVPLSRFDRVIEWLLILLLAFMPLAFGAVEAWSEQVVIALCTAITICFLLKLVFRPDIEFRWSWTYLPIGFFLLLIVFQLVPLPAAVVKAISPNTASIRTELLGDLPDADSVLSFMTISFYPNATVHDLRMALAMAALFVVVLNVYRRPSQVNRLLAAVVIIGGLIAVLAMAQDLFGNGKIYWVVSCYDKAFSGPFINHGNYGQFMNLSIGAALALVLVKLHEIFAGKRLTPPAVFESLGFKTSRALWLLVLMMMLGAATIFVSLTRGGIIGMLIAGSLTTLVLTSRRSFKGQGWIMLLMALGAFICVLYIGFDAVYDRLATLRDLHETQGRMEILKGVATAWTTFPVVGTGLGTHEVVYPMFDRTTLPGITNHAENEYAQMAEETGLMGLVPLLILTVIIWIGYIRNVRNSRASIYSAAYGLGFGLLAVMIHSLGEFARVPANASLFVIFCALLCVIARMAREKEEPKCQTRLLYLALPIRVLTLLVVSSILVWSLLGTNSARIAEGHWKKALIAESDMAKRNWQGSDEEYINLISNAAAAVDYQPANAEYRHWLNVYRWRSISRITNPEISESVIPEAAIKFVPRIIDEFNKVRTLCPTYGPTYCVTGQLEKFVLDNPAGAGLIRKGYRLAPCDPTVCFVAGFLDTQEAKEGWLDESFKKFSRAVELDNRMFAGVADIYVNQVKRPDLALTIAGDNIGRLSHVANILSETKEHNELVVQVRSQVAELLKSRCQQPDAPAWAFASLAHIYTKQEANTEAIECYRRALALDYSQVYWRLSLARLLAETEQVTEAIHEARICLRLRPQFKAAEKLIAELSVLPGSDTGENPAL